MSNQRILFDKNIAKRILEGLTKRERGMELNDQERIAAKIFDAEILSGKRLFIVPGTGNFLARFYSTHKQVREFRNHVEVIVPARYYKRWSRRLQAFGFTREDARVLSYGTFETDEQESFLGVDEVLTFDKPLATLFEEKQERIQEKLDAMKREVEPPYDDARLPKVTIPKKME